MNTGMFTSKTYEWETPKWLYDQLNKEYGPFILDPCATKENAKCKKYYTRQEDGLKQKWHGRVFVNPPYGREIGKWIKKAYESAGQNALIVCLIPARTDTRWWHDYVMKGKVRFIRGRLRFGGSKNHAPFPSAIVVFGEQIIEAAEKEAPDGSAD